MSELENRVRHGVVSVGCRVILKRSLAVDLVGVLLFIPCLPNCFVEAIQKCLERLPWTAYQQSQRLAFVAGA